MPTAISTAPSPRPEILVVNPNTSVATTDMLASVAQTAALPSISIRAVHADSGPPMIITDQELLAAGTPTVQAALDAMALRTPGAVIIGGFGDPGIDELRTRTDIPVIGIGQSSIAEARHFGHRFAIATTTPGLGMSLTHLVEKHAPGDDFAGVFFTRTAPLDLAADPGRMADELNIAIDDALDAGAQTVIIGGGPLSATAALIAQRDDVRIVEPMPAAIRAAIAAMTARASVHGSVASIHVSTSVPCAD